MLEDSDSSSRQVAMDRIDQAVSEQLDAANDDSTALMSDPVPADRSGGMTVDLYWDEFNIAIGTTYQQLLDQQAAGIQEVSLREAVYAARFGDSDNPIVYLPNGTYEINGNTSAETDGLTGDLDIEHDVTIVGETREGTILTTVNNTNDRLFHVHSGTLTLSDMTVQNVVSDSTGSVALVQSNAALDVQNTLIVNNWAGSSGGAISSLGDVTISNSGISNNSALNPQAHSLSPNHNSIITLLRAAPEVLSMLSLRSWPEFHWSAIAH